MSSKRSAALFAFLENYVALAINVVSSIVVARLLNPEQIGIFSVAAAVVFLCNVIRDFGVGTYVIQEVELTELRLRAAFTLTCLTSWLVGGVLVAARGPIAEFYGVPGLADVLIVLGINFALMPFGSVTLAYMRRTLRFDRAAATVVVSSLANCVTVIVLAYRGHGYMSPAWASVVGTVTGIVMLLALRPAGLPWLPSFREARRVLSFSAFSSTGTLIGSIGSRMPDLLIGKVLDMHSVGIFSRANGMLDLFNTALMNAIHKFALPHFADVHRSGADMQASFLQAARYITAFSFPFFASVAIVAPLVVRLLFGDQWDEAVPLARVLCISAAAYSPYHVWSAALTAIGRFRRVTAVIVLSQTVNLALMAVSISYGLQAFAWGMVVAGFLSIAIIAMALRTLVPVRLVMAAIAPSVALTACTIPGPAIALLGWDSRAIGAPIALSLALLLGIAGWMLAVRWSRHPVYVEIVRAITAVRRLKASGT